MIEKERICFINLNPHPNGDFQLSAAIEGIFVDDNGTVIATKPERQDVGILVKADDPGLVALVGLVMARRDEMIEQRVKMLAVAAAEAKAEADRASAEARRRAAEAKK